MVARGRGRLISSAKLVYIPTPLNRRWGYSIRGVSEMEADTGEVKMGEYRAMAKEDEYRIQHRKFYIPPRLRDKKLGGETEKR